MRINIFFLLFALLIWNSSSAYTPFRNYNKTVQVNDIEIIDGTVWVVSNGGLAKVSKDRQKVSPASMNQPFTDVKLTSIVPDGNGGMWIGSENGVLYHYKGGKLISFNNYQFAQWDIRDLSIHNDHLLISSSKGLSVFDIEKRAAVANAVSFQGYGPQVNHALVHGDTLYAAFSSGLAKAFIGDKPWRELNFADEKIWDIQAREAGVEKILVDKGNVKDYAYLTVHSGNSVYHADSATLYKDGVKVISLPSKITEIEIGADGTFWCGTTDDYFYAISDGNARQLKIPGLFFGNVSRVAVGPRGKIWFNPRLSWQNLPWWQGVVSYDGSQWQLYNNTTVEDFRVVGDGDEFLGITEDRLGNMWFGVNGEGLRKYDTENDKWSRYFVGVKTFSEFRKFDPGESYWSKCDALATDSSGYLWASAFDCFEGKLVCYNPAVEDPADKDYLRISQATGEQFTSINVDQVGRIFAGSRDGQFLVITHNGTPLDGVTVESHNMNCEIFDMTSTSDGYTFIATDKGIYRWGTDRHNPVLLENSPSDIRTIEQENSSVLWLGSNQNGLTRWKRNDVSAGAYDNESQISDRFEGELTTYTTSEGLVNNSINWIDIDHARGVLWIATTDGVSSFDLGYSISATGNNKKISVYPNPFKKDYHTEVVFENIAPRSVINIYSVKGQLVTNLNETNTNVRKNDNAWIYIWKVPDDLLPGTYVAVADGTQKTSPQKILIRP